MTNKNKNKLRHQDPLASVKKEMAKPRVARSARIDERNQGDYSERIASTGRTGSLKRRRVA